MKSRNIDKQIEPDATVMGESSSIISDDLGELISDLVGFAEETEGVSKYKGTYSREDIYFDHD